MTLCKCYKCDSYSTVRQWDYATVALNASNISLTQYLNHNDSGAWFVCPKCKGKIDKEYLELSEMPSEEDFWSNEI